MAEAEFVTVEGNRIRGRAIPRKNTINSQRLWLRKSIYTEPLGQKYSFYGRKQRKEKTVDRHRQGGNRNISKCFCQADLMQGRKEIALEHTTDKNKRDQCSEKF